MTATHSEGQRHVYHWVTSPFLLIRLGDSLGTEDINCCSFAREFFPLHDAPDIFSRRLDCREASQAHALYDYEATLL